MEIDEPTLLNTPVHPNSKIIKNLWPIDVKCYVTFKRDNTTKYGHIRKMKTNNSYLFIGNNGDWIRIHPSRLGTEGLGVVSKIVIASSGEEWIF
jgi:hypothetical protein